MGNHRFRLSDMIPNAWFYKLRDMSSRTRTQSSSKKKTQNQTTSTLKPNISQPRQSYYYTRDSITKGYKLYNSPANTKSSGNSHFLDPPRRSSRRRSRRKTVYRPSPAAASASGMCTCGGAEADDYFDDFDELLKSPTSEFDSDNVDVPQSFNGLASWSSSCSCTFSSSATDIVFDMNEKSRAGKSDGGYDTISELDLPPILTKLPAGNSRNSDTLEQEEEGSLCFKEESGKTRSRKSFSQSTGVKLRANSPKIGSRKIQSHARKSVSSGKRSKVAAKKSFSGSFAVVKASFDPEKDFRESMMEMIVENNIKGSKDLEELLACYLSLNSDEYHALIIKAFQQIWFNLSDLHL